MVRCLSTICTLVKPAPENGDSPGETPTGRVWPQIPCVQYLNALPAPPTGHNVPSWRSLHDDAAGYCMQHSCLGSCRRDDAERCRMEIIALAPVRFRDSLLHAHGPCIQALDLSYRGLGVKRAKCFARYTPPTRLNCFVASASAVCIGHLSLPRRLTDQRRLYGHTSSFEQILL